MHLAGIFVTHELTADSRGVWDQTLGANLDNAYDLTVAALPHFDAGSVARVVYITSLAFRRGSPDHVAYSAAKGGLVGLTRALSRKLAHRALVNAIAPGITAIRWFGAERGAGRWHAADVWKTSPIWSTRGPMPSGAWTGR